MTELSPWYRVDTPSNLFVKIVMSSEWVDEWEDKREEGIGSGFLRETRGGLMIGLGAGGWTSPNVAKTGFGFKFSLFSDFLLKNFLR